MLGHTQLQNVVITTGKNYDADTTVRILWYEKRTKNSRKGSYGPFFNEKFFARISGHEKAALAFLSTLVSSNCELSQDTPHVVNCRLTDMLNLGVQCSPQHLGYLRQWFRDDVEVMRRLVADSCSSTPSGASTQHSFGSIDLQENKKQIKLIYYGQGMSLRREEVWEWSETLVFRKDSEQRLFLISRTLTKSR